MLKIAENLNQKDINAVFIFTTNYLKGSIKFTLKYDGVFMAISLIVIVTNVLFSTCLYKWSADFFLMCKKLDQLPEVRYSIE